MAVTHGMTVKLATAQSGTTPLLTQLRLPDINQHVRVRAVPDGEVVIVPPVVVLDGFFFRTPRHHIIIKFAPLDRRATRRQPRGSALRSTRTIRQWF